MNRQLLARYIVRFMLLFGFGSIVVTGQTLGFNPVVWIELGIWGILLIAI